jgi:chromosomal replication initiation ATPase DnaA
MITDTELSAARAELTLLEREGRVLFRRRKDLEDQSRQLAARARALLARLAQPGTTTTAGDDETIADAVCRQMGTDLRSLRRRDRSVARVRLRAAAYAELRERGWSYQRIASCFQRDHTAVVHALRSTCQPT